MYLLFSGFHFYPSGGWNDYEGSYGTAEDAVKAAASIDCDWWHVACGENIVESGIRPDPY